MAFNNFSKEIEETYESMSADERQDILGKQKFVHLNKDHLLANAKDLTFHERGVLLTLILQQVTGEVLPEYDTGEVADLRELDRIMKTAYRNIGEDIAKDNEKYVKKVILNRINGSKSKGRPPKDKK